MDSLQKICSSRGKTRRKEQASTHLIGSTISRIAIRINGGFEEQNYAEKKIIELFFQFNHKTIDDKNGDCEKDQYLSAVSKASGVAKVPCQLTEVQPQISVTGNLANRSESS